MAILDDPRDILPQLVTELNRPQWDRRWAYFIGNHPKAWVSTKVREVFQALADSFTENYCGLAVNARVSRLEITGVGENAAADLWETSGFAQRQDQFFRWSLAHGSAYLIAGHNDQDEQVVAANSARVCYAEPDPNNWTRLAWAGKVWRDQNTWRVTVYDDENVWRFVAPYTKGKRVDVKALVPDPETDAVTPHGFDRIPVVGVHPFGADAPVLLDQISPVQDRINKLGSNKFVAAEFGAFKQRVFFTRQDLDPRDVINAPDHAIILDPGDADAAARVQELSTTDLANYDDAKNAEVDALFTIATLPRHLRVNPGATPSGEAIKADEGPFVEALHDLQREFGTGIRNAWALLGEDIQPQWRDVEVHNELSSAQVVRTMVESGVAWQVAVRKYANFSPEDVKEAEDLIAVLTAQQAGAEEAALRSSVIGL